MSDRQPGAGALSGFPVRVATAAAYGVILLGVILVGGIFGLAILVAVLATLATVEYLAIARRTHRGPIGALSVTAVAAMPLAAAAWGVDGLIAVVTGLVVLALVLHVLFGRIAITDTASGLFGAVYIGFTLSHLVLIRSLDWGVELVLAVVVSVWASDVFAYLVGSTLGRHRMAPAISPKKSWEGFAAGTLATITVWVLVWATVGAGLTLARALAIGAAIAIASVLGDLFESRLKREAGVKDSGTLLPGHGGFLDRIDSLILVSVAAYYLLSTGALA